MSDYETAKAAKAAIDAQCKAASATLAAMSGGGPLNLTPDTVKQSPEYQAAKHAFDIAFAQCRGFNRWFIRRFRAEIRGERRQRA